MPKSAFSDPLRRLSIETTWLHHEFLKAAANRNVCDQLACEMAVVRLHDAWARFCRELVILSASGKTQTLGGTRLKPSSNTITNRSAVIPVLLSTFKKKKIYEPNWWSASECIDAASRLSTMNLSTISAAIGAINSPAEEMRHVRNFFVHRRNGTARRAVSTGCFPSQKPLVFELTSYKSGNTTVIESWVVGLIAVATAAAQ